ncbi:uncharacterized protein LOC144665876 [Oculina patagonica]
MAQNRRTISKIEFNKRVRDLVSRDSNRLRQTFQKFDKECASRLAEIQSMQEKVRHSMRNLTQEKMQARPGSEFGNLHRGARKESETERGRSVPDEHQEGSKPESRVLSTDERMKHNNKASLPGIHFIRSDHLEVPNRGQARSRRYSLPHPPTFLPGSPKESRALPIHASHTRTTMASSLPKEAFIKPGSPNEASLISNISGSPKQSLRGVNLQYTQDAGNRKSDYRLSVSELPISSSRSDPLSSVRIKLSPQFDRKGHIVASKETTAGKDHDITTESDKGDTSDQDSFVKDSKSPKESCASLQHQQTNETNRSFDHAIETKTRRENDSNYNAKLKTPLKRTRSSSLPCDPDLLKNFKPRDSHRSVGVSRPSRSANHAGGTTRAVSPGVTLQKGKETASKPFDELYNCRYLRTSKFEAIRP